VNGSDLTFSLVLLGSMGALALLLFVDYLIHRKRPFVFQVSEVRKESSGPAAPIATVPKPASLPRLQPLAFMDVLCRSLKDFRANLILIIPLLVEYLWSEVSYGVSRYLKPSSNSANVVNLVSVIIFLGVFIVVYLGQISLTGAAVSRGKASLRDWRDGFKYFWTLFVLVSVFGLLFAGPYFGLERLYQNVKPLGTLVAYLTYVLVTFPLPALGQSFLFVCFAAVGLDKKPFVGSVKAAWRVLSDRWGVFLRFVVFSLGASIAYDALARLIAPILNSASLTFPANDFGLILFFVYGLGDVILTSLLFLIAFRIYWGFKEQYAIGSTEHSMDRVQHPMRKQFCVECGTELAYGSKFCNKCGAKQEWAGQ